MYQNYNKYRVLQALFDRPTTGLHLREIAREAQLAPYSTKRYLEELEEEGLLQSKEGRYAYPLYYAEMDNQKYKLLRRQNVALRLEESGLLDELYDELGATCIILFGSASRGEDVEESDIDLYIEGEVTEPELEPYEFRLQRKISIISSKTFEEMGEGLKNNLLNADTLRGYVQAYPDEPLPKRHARSATRTEPRPASGRDAARPCKHQGKRVSGAGDEELL